jgi:hypothetical protein
MSKDAGSGADRLTGKRPWCFAVSVEDRSAMGKLSVALVATIVVAIIGCARSPTDPRVEALALGRWSDGSVCLSVTEQACDLVVGCGHGQFPRPDVGGDGAFAVDGTYRIEVGPISINPAPPARFVGKVAGDTLTITVIPTQSSLTPATYALRVTNSSARCTVPCL